MRRRIYLLRHGAVSYFGRDGRPLRTDQVPLSEKGRTQALHTGQFLSGIPFDRAITSDLLRTRETAKLVLDQQAEGQTAPPIERRSEFNEIREGRLEEIPNQDIGQAFMGAFSANPGEEVRFLGGESIGEFLDRVLPAFETLLQDRGWDTLLMVLHGGVNRALLSRVLTGQRQFLGSFEQAPACINVLDVGHTNIVRAVNINPSDRVHKDTRNTTMEDLLLEYQAGLASKQPTGDSQ